MAEPSIAQLRAFAGVARERHFGLAADELGVTQPAVSAALRALEQSLGGRLVERTSRRVLVTALGEALLPAAEQVLAALDDFVATAAGAVGSHTGPLRLGVIPTVAPYLLPTLLGSLGTEFPALDPEVREDQTRHLLDALTAGALDLVVLALPAGRADVVELPLYWEEFLLLVPEGHPAAGGPLPLADLSRLDVLLLSEGHCLRDQALEVCHQAGATGRTAQAASLTTLSQLVAADLGVTLLPATAVPVEVRRGLATARFMDSPPPGRTIGLVHRQTSARAQEYEEIAGTLRRALSATSLPLRLPAGP